MTPGIVVAGSSRLVRSAVREALRGADRDPGPPATEVTDADEVTEVTGAAEVGAACAGGAALLVTDVEVDGVPLLDLLPAVLATDARVLVLCPRAAAGAVPPLLLAGASGVLLLEECTAADLGAAVRETLSGRATLHPAVADLVLQQWRADREGRPPALTAKELEVLTAMLGGEPVKTIARALGLSARTVDSHRARIFVKLGVRTHAQAVQRALDLGMVRR